MRLNTTMYLLTYYVTVKVFRKMFDESVKYYQWRKVRVGKVVDGKIEWDMGG